MASRKQSSGMWIGVLFWRREIAGGGAVQRSTFNDRKRNGGCQLLKYQSMGCLRRREENCNINGRAWTKYLRQPWPSMARFCLRWKSPKSTWTLSLRLVGLQVFPLLFKLTPLLELNFGILSAACVLSLCGARVNQQPPVHHDGWMVGGQETIFHWVLVPLLPQYDHSSVSVLDTYLLTTHQALLM